MKNLLKITIFVALLSCSSMFGQGLTTTPFDTTGWSPPASYTTWYGLRIFTLLSNPGGGYNRNMRDIDSLMYDLVVYTDTSQMYIGNDTLRFASGMSGIGVFNSTDQYDTVSVPGIDVNDVVVVTIRDQIPGANDALGVSVSAGKFIVVRAAAGTSGLKYNWIWIRKYE